MGGPPPAPAVAAFSLRCVRGALAKRRFALGASTVIGRATGLDICLPDSSVSRRHAEIRVTPNGVLLQDAGSANGTWLNGRLVRGQARIRRGDRLQFGLTGCVFQVSGPPQRKMVRAASLIGAAMVLAAPPLAWVGLSRAPVNERTGADLARGGGMAHRSNPELAALLETIHREQQASEHFRRAEEEIGHSRPEEALDYLLQIPPESRQFRRAPPQVLPLVKAVKNQAGKEIRRQAKSKHGDLALHRCEKYISPGCEDRASLMNALQQETGSLELAEALTSYWDGRSSDARAQLKRIAEASGADELGSEVKQVEEGLASVERLFKQGEGFLGAKVPELARAPLLKALEEERRLLRGLADRHPSFYRRKIQEEMARSCYALGRRWVDRRDRRKACRTWKLGFEFYKGNADLNKAIASCSRHGADALRNVRSCEQLVEMLDFAVEGDGLAQTIEEIRARLRCRA